MGLGDQESGVSGGRQLVKKTSILLSKWGRWALSDRATFSDFVGADNENVGENRNSLKTSHQIQRLLSNYSMTTLLQDEKPVLLNGKIHEAIRLSSDTLLR